MSLFIKKVKLFWHSKVSNSKVMCDLTGIRICLRCHACPGYLQFDKDLIKNEMGYPPDIIVSIVSLWEKFWFGALGK